MFGLQTELNNCFNKITIILTKPNNLINSCFHSFIRQIYTTLPLICVPEISRTRDI